jgi:hypothetical protein
MHDISFGTFTPNIDFASVMQLALKALSFNAREIISKKRQKNSFLKGMKKKIVLEMLA